MTPKSTYIDVVGCADSRYARHYSVVVASVLAHAREPEKFRFFFVGAEPWDEESRESLLALAQPYGASVCFPILDIERLKSAPTNAHISLASYYRLLLPDVLPMEVEKFIYLDADVVVRADLADFFALELSNEEFVGAITDARFERWHSLGMQPSMGYFNAGILLVNLRLWRETEMSRQLVQFVADHGPVLKFHDQDTLNAVFAGRWRRLDPRWNQQYLFFLVPGESLGLSRAEYRRLLDDPFIVHFSGGSKPWMFADDHPFRLEYYEVLDRTSYAGWRPKPAPKDLLRVPVRFFVPHRYRAPVLGW
jgi:lipopolysaccharide biosynthesis glycosyltransferase